MARVVDYYTATMTSRWYIFPDAHSMDGGIQQEPGTPLTLPADYYERSENSRYPVSSPTVSGWLNYTYIGDITPVYKTVTDPCSPPTNITLDVNAKVLTIAGGSGGDLNTFNGYGLSWRDRPLGSSTWGSWSSDSVVNATSPSATVVVDAPAGYVRQFRARTTGSAGSSYYSDYLVCTTTLTGNTAPVAPTINLPSANVTVNQSPFFKLTCPSDPDGDSMSLMRKIDGGAWETVKTLNNGVVYDKLPTLSYGSHTIYYKLADKYAESNVVSRVIVAKSQKWKRNISSGTVIANTSISHKADITELLDCLNIQRAWYGLQAIALRGTLGRFADWQAQMQDLLNGANEFLAVCGVSANGLSIPTYPTASVINAIREMITGTYKVDADDTSAKLGVAILGRMRLGRS